MAIVCSIRLQLNDQYRLVMAVYWSLSPLPVTVQQSDVNLHLYKSHEVVIGYSSQKGAGMPDHHKQRADEGQAVARSVARDGSAPGDMLVWSVRHRRVQVRTV